MRKDGVRVKNANPMYLVMNQFLRYRYDAMNQLTLDIPIEPMRKYMRAKKSGGHSAFTYGPRDCGLCAHAG